MPSEGDKVMLAYDWLDAIVLLKELEVYKEIIAEHLPSVHILYEELKRYVKES